MTNDLPSATTLLQPKKAKNRHAQRNWVPRRLDSRDPTGFLLCRCGVPLFLQATIQDIQEKLLPYANVGRRQSPDHPNYATAKQREYNEEDGLGLLGSWLKTYRKFIRGAGGGVVPDGASAPRSCIGPRPQSVERYARALRRTVFLEGGYKACVRSVRFESSQVDAAPPTPRDNRQPSR